MSSSLNKCIIIGRLGADPEIVPLRDGRVACRLSVATSQRWKDRSTDTPREIVQWHRVIVFQQSAVKFAESYLKKGDLVYVEGAVSTNCWQDSDGTDRWSTQVQISAAGSRLLKLNSKSSGASKMLDQNIEREPDDIVWSSKGIVLSANAGCDVTNVPS